MGGTGYRTRLVGGDRLILAGNDNDYSVTQTGAGEQFDVYVDFEGNVAKCVLDDPTQCEVNPAADDTVIDNPVPVPDGYELLPGVLHALPCVHNRPRRLRRAREGHHYSG